MEHGRHKIYIPELAVGEIHEASSYISHAHMEPRNLFEKKRDKETKTPFSISG